jgi:hypothetical protein
MGKQHREAELAQQLRGRNQHQHLR